MAITTNTATILKCALVALALAIGFIAFGGGASAGETPCEGGRNRPGGVNADWREPCLTDATLGDEGDKPLIKAFTDVYNGECRQRLGVGGVAIPADHLVPSSP